MTPNIFTLCHYASEHNGSLTIVDTFDRIKAHKFPWRDDFYVVSKFRIDEKYSSHKEILLKIFSLINERKVIFETKNNFEYDKSRTELNIIAEFRGLIFENEGKYAFCIYLDNKLMGEYQFNVSSEDE